MTGGVEASVRSRRGACGAQAVDPAKVLRRSITLSSGNAARSDGIAAMGFGMIHLLAGLATTQASGRSVRELRRKGNLDDLWEEVARRLHGPTAHYVAGVGYHHHRGMRRRQVTHDRIEA